MNGSMKRAMTHLLLSTLLFIGSTSAAVAVAVGEDPTVTLIKQAIRDRIAEEYEAPGREIEIGAVELPAAFKPSAQFSRIEVTLPYKSRAGRKVFATVSLFDGERQLARANGVASVKQYATAVTAARDLPRQTMLTDEDMTVTRFEIQNGHGQILTDPAEAVGKRTDRLVRKGEPIRADRVVTPQLVATGDLVTVVASTGTLRITTIAKAKQGGDRGDWIAVTNVESNKTFNARVTGPGVVSVTF